MVPGRRLNPAPVTLSAWKWRSLSLSLSFVSSPAPVFLVSISPSGLDSV